MEKITKTEVDNYNKVMVIDNEYFVPDSDEESAAVLKANPRAVMVWRKMICVKYHRGGFDTHDGFIFYRDGFHTYGFRDGRLIDPDVEINPCLFPYFIFGRGYRLEVKIYPSGRDSFRIEPWELLPDNFIRAMPAQLLTTDELREWLKEEEVDLKIDSSLFSSATQTERAATLAILGGLLKW